MVVHVVEGRGCCVAGPVPRVDGLDRLRRADKRPDGRGELGKSGLY